MFLFCIFLIDITHVIASDEENAILRSEDGSRHSSPRTPDSGANPMQGFGFVSGIPVDQCVSHGATICPVTKKPLQIGDSVYVLIQDRPKILQYDSVTCISQAGFIQLKEGGKKWQHPGDSSETPRGPDEYEERRVTNPFTRPKRPPAVANLENFQSQSHVRVAASIFKNRLDPLLLIALAVLCSASTFFHLRHKFVFHDPLLQPDV